MTAKKQPGRPAPTALERQDRLLGEADGHLASSAHWLGEAIKAFNNLREYQHADRGRLAVDISRAYTARADAINYRYRDEERNQT